MKRYDHYVGIDWSKVNMAIARMTKNSHRAQTVELKSNIKDVQAYLKSLRGSKIITFEESTAAQWLYVCLKDYANKIVVCDPRRNYLLKEGAKTDRVDAEKLVELLRGNYLREVYHTADHFISLRKLVSDYEDTIKFGVQAKNRRSALLQSKGKDKTEKELPGENEQFVLSNLDEQIKLYEKQKQAYEAKFHSLRKKYHLIRCIESVPGIGLINAVKILATVVDPTRFPDKRNFLRYCGLLLYLKESGGKCYGKRKPNYSRRLKDVFKTATHNLLVEKAGQGFFKQYYEYLLNEKNYSKHNARHALARKIATVTFGVMKQGVKYDPGRYAHVTQKASCQR